MTEVVLSISGQTTLVLLQAVKKTELISTVVTTAIVQALNRLVVTFV